MCGARDERQHFPFRPGQADGAGRAAGAVAPSGSCFFVLIFTYFVYLPGLSGGFLFDDFPNLQHLGDLGGVIDKETFSSFVFGGFSGPTGRPVSLASFFAG